MRIDQKIVPIEMLSKELEAWLKADRRMAQKSPEIEATGAAASPSDGSSKGTQEITAVSGVKPEEVVSEQEEKAPVVAERRASDRRASIGRERRVSRRIGMLTSIDGDQIVAVLLDPAGGKTELWRSDLTDNSYTSLTLAFPQLHWSERLLWNLFGIIPRQHPRLKPIAIHEEYPKDFFPLRQTEFHDNDLHVDHGLLNFLEVKGEGVWELPVGPIHAGVIEPGHFRFSCLGETIVNLELRFGYVHRGIEKRIAEVPWRKARFVVEAAASDTAAANALAHAIAIESLFDVEVPERAQLLRTIALETERVAMHVADVGGMMTDIGMVGLAATMSRLRGTALNWAQILSGSRFLRAYILPGGVASAPTATEAAAIKNMAVDLRNKLRPVLSMFQENQAAIGRMDGIGRIKLSLADEFGFVGVAARGCGLTYDARRHFAHGLFPAQAPEVSFETGGDILSRTNVRIKEIWTSLDLIEKLAQDPAISADAPIRIDLPEKLPANKQSVAVVEAFRGELVHLCITGEDGLIKRYAIKDPSHNNWTMISIVVRDNLIADFPLCNKSLSLSYSGNDL